LLCPLDQPGVEIRRIATINGEREFCEVFFTDARTPATHVVGEVNEGWAVANTLLGFERGESAATFPLRFREELDRLIELAQTRGRSDDPIIRQGLARAHEEARSCACSGCGAHRPAGRPSAGSESSVSKLYWSEYHQRATTLALQILGADALAPHGALADEHGADRRSRRFRRLGVAGEAWLSAGPRQLDRGRHERDHAQHPR
jgi:alkylation response protein AidB-like acyl-CoA dehydrogenase